MRLALSHAIQLFFLHRGITLDKLMLAVITSALLIFGMLVAHNAETEEQRVHPGKPLTVTQTSDGWTCIKRSGDVQQHCYSEPMMQMIEMWRDEVRYLPKRG